MDIFTVCFFGHRQIEEPHFIENRITDILRPLMEEKNYLEFLIGKNGEFDAIVTRTIRKLKNAVRDDNNSLILVLPYLTAEFHNNKDEFLRIFDEIEICEKSSSVHFKAAIQKRNQEMIHRSDLVICYVNKNTGGAYQSLCYAEKENKTVYNIIEP